MGNILQNIDLPGLLQGVNSFVKLIGAFCPPLSQVNLTTYKTGMLLKVPPRNGGITWKPFQVLDNVIQNVTSTAFRVFGRAILRSGGLGGGSGASGGDSGQRVNVVLPTFPPDEDYEDEEDESVTGASTSAVFAQELDAVTDAVILYTVCPHLCSMWRTSLTAWSATWTILQRYFAGLCNCYYCGCNFCCCPPVA